MQTAIELEMRRLGKAGPEHRLADTIERCFKEHGPALAGLEAFIAQIYDDPELLLALFTEKQIRDAAAWRWRVQVKKLRADHGGQLWRDHQVRTAPAARKPKEPSEEKGATLALDDQDTLAPDSDGSPDGSAERVHERHGCRRPYDTADSDAGGGGVHSNVENHMDADPSVTARQKRKREIMTSAAKTILDTFKVRNGKPIGDLTVPEAHMLSSENVREGLVLKQLVRRIGHAPEGAILRDLVTAEDVERANQKAGEMSDAIL